jgi:hypothetical protein
MPWKDQLCKGCDARVSVLCHFDILGDCDGSNIIRVSARLIALSITSRAFMNFNDDDHISLVPQIPFLLEVAYDRVPSCLDT